MFSLSNASAQRQQRASKTTLLLSRILLQIAPDSRIHVSMPEAAAEAILKALAKKREDRFSSVGEFVAELGESY